VKNAENSNSVATATSGGSDAKFSYAAPTRSRVLAFGSILVPIDFSDCSEAALTYATSFAKKFDASMTFVHVLPENDAFSWGRETPDDDPWREDGVENEANSRLSKMIRETVPASVPTRIEIRHGAPSIEIMEVAKELQVNLIIMSTHGHTGRVHAFLGSVASDVTRLASCPVLVVHRQEAHPKLEHEPTGSVPEL
jgi:nucleotide-binding universal stress UspA family protein